MAVLLPILMYHQVLPEDRIPAENHLYVSVDDLRRQIHALKGWGWKFSTLRKSWAGLGNGRQGKCVVLTFDDVCPNFKDHVLPILREEKIPATVFAVAGCVSSGEISNPPYEGFSGLGGSALRELEQEGIEVGSHGLTHREMIRLAGADLTRECAESRDILEGALCRSVKSFCYPRGAFSPRVGAAVREAGYACAVTTLRGSVQDPEDPFALRRIRMSRERHGLRLRYTLTHLYDWFTHLRRRRMRAGMAEREVAST